MVELHSKIRELVKQLDVDGFGGVPVDADDADGLRKGEVVHIPGDPSSPNIEDAELTEEQWAARERDYAIMRASPDFDCFSPHFADSKYVEVMVHEGVWWSDFLKHLSDVVGPGVTIKHHEGPGEVEFIRKAAK